MKVDLMVGKAELWYQICWGIIFEQHSEGLVLFRKKMTKTKSLYALGFVCVFHPTKKKINVSFSLPNSDLFGLFCMFPSGGELDLTLCSLH